ncbi:MAG: PatB family C-S lyase [Candidatus Aminicenantales bacterium]|jgi:cystathionine beta-lyase
MIFDFDARLDRRGTGSMKWDAASRIYGVDDVIPLWVADMDIAAPPAVVDALKRRVEHPIYGYPMLSPTYWDPVVRWLDVRQGWAVRREWIAACPGVVPALNLCVQAFSRPGDKIVIQTPVYHPFYFAAENNGRRLVENPLRFADGRWTMDLDDLARRIDGRTRLVVLCSPHNPVGRVWTPVELGALGRLAADRGLVIIADEIHSDLVFDGRRHTPLASLEAGLAARTVTLQAPSKTFNTAGLTAAFAVISDPGLRARFDAQLECAGLSIGNVFGQAALQAAYAEGGPWLDALRIYLEGNFDFADAFFRERLPALRFLRPEGTYLALIDARGLGLEPGALFKFFLEKARVHVDEGTKFGPALAGFLRMNMASPRTLLGQAFERIRGALRS